MGVYIVQATVLLRVIKGRDAKQRAEVLAQNRANTLNQAVQVVGPHHTMTFNPEKKEK
jgi:hypothetical protein